ncbi:chromo domain protein [Aspergillus luchuensis]|uniref:Chromo domain protein n=1 Tax=Aspergillus kawachii TaxID=1069201 RepID=A0A146FT22_ASPKA|nr:chromo domain protein [Aspergillus luchuensis]
MDFVWRTSWEPVLMIEIVSRLSASGKLKARKVAAAATATNECDGKGDCGTVPEIRPWI